MGFFTDLAESAFANYVQNKDIEDTLKSLVFITSYKATLNRDYKKIIAKVMQLVDEEFSFFRDEEKIDTIYANLKNVNSQQFFETILSLRIDRDKIISFFIIDLFFVLALENIKLITPQNIYNLYLVKKHFDFSRQELATCYKAVADLQNADFDDTAEAIEALTSEEAIEILVKKYPNLIEIETQNEKDIPKIEENTAVSVNNSEGATYNQLESIEESCYEVREKNTVSNQDNEIPTGKQKNSDKRRLPALLLCLFLGVIGAHRFYVGKFGTAILQIITIACFGIGTLWWLIDFIMIITGKFTDKTGLPLEVW